MRRIKKAIAGATVVGLLPVAAVAALGDEAGATYCPEFGEIVRTGVTDTDTELREASGVVASAQNPGIFWTHNDNPKQNRVFALDAAGNLVAQFELTGVTTGSIEDIAVGVGPDGSDWLYLADFGDNRDARPHVSFHRFPEPDVDLSWYRSQESVAGESVQTIKVAYQKPGTDETWSRDAEAAAIDPLTGDLFIFEKKFQRIDGTPQASYVYRVPASELSEGEVRIAEQVSYARARTLDDGAGFTAADISRDGSLVMVKNMYETFVWPRLPDESVADVLDRHPTAPCRAPAEVGEAIGVVPDGSAYVMIREGRKTPIWQTAITRGVVDDSTAPEPPGTVPPAPEPTEPPGTVPPAPEPTEPPGTVPPAPEPTEPPGTVPPAPEPTEPPGTVPPAPEPPVDDVVIGGAGDDPVSAGPPPDSVTLLGESCDGLIATITGTDGDDVLFGTSGPDVIFGGDGNDEIDGRGGNDIICGGPGDDVLRGASGNDLVFGGTGNDRIYGGAGNDLLRGHSDDDHLRGGEGDDVIAGNLGRDVLIGAEGNDRLVGDTADTCYDLTMSYGSHSCTDKD